MIVDVKMGRTKRNSERYLQKQRAKKISEAKSFDPLVSDAVIEREYAKPKSTNLKQERALDIPEPSFSPPLVDVNQQTVFEPELPKEKRDRGRPAKDRLPTRRKKISFLWGLFKYEY